MKTRYPFPLKLIALLTSVIFCWDQIVWADGLLSQDYAANPQSQVVSAVESQKAVETSVAEIFTTTDFLAGTSPLSEPEKRSAQTLEQPAPKASIETTADGHSIHHVYAGESIQQAVDRASAIWNTIFTSRVSIRLFREKILCR